MEDSSKTNQELVKEISLLKQRIEGLEQLERERKRMEEALRASQAQSSGATDIVLSQAKVLSGLLRICSSCKKIRNDNGYWEQIEMYVRDHSEAEFSHGICPECAEKLYPEFYKKK